MHLEFHGAHKCGEKQFGAAELNGIIFGVPEPKTGWSETNQGSQSQPELDSVVGLVTALAHVNLEASEGPSFPEPVSFSGNN